MMIAGHTIANISTNIIKPTVYVDIVASKMHCLKFHVAVKGANTVPDTAPVNQIPPIMK